MKQFPAHAPIRKWSGKDFLPRGPAIGAQDAYSTRW